MAKASTYGRGSVRAKGEDRWELRVFAGRDVLTGKQRYVSRAVRGTKREAENALAALLLEVAAGQDEQSGADVDLVRSQRTSLVPALAVFTL